LEEFILELKKNKKCDKEEKIKIYRRSVEEKETPEGLE
jgi:hypothetical protein